MKLKRLLACILVLVMVLSIAACSKEETTDTADTPDTQTATDAPAATEAPAAATDAPAATDETAAEPVTLRMAWWGSQTRHDRTVEVINMYMAENPNVTIEYEFYDFDGYFNKLNTLVAANDVWDMFQLGGNFPTYLDKIVPMNDYIASGIIDTSDTTDAYLRITNYEGNQLALSSGVNSYGIAYDPQMFADAGVAEPTSTWTWEDYKQACLTIHEKLGVFGSSKMDDFICGCSMMVPQNSFDLSYFNYNLDNMGFDDYTLLIPWFDLRKELVDAGAYPDPGALAEITNIENDFVVTGEAAMTWVATNQFATLAQASGKNLKLINPPRITADGPAGVAVQSSQMFCISKDSEAPEEAAKFLNYFINSEEANKVLLGERGTPIMGKIRDAVAASADDFTKQSFEYLDLIGTFEVGGEFNPLSPACQDEIKDYHTNMLEKVLYGELTSDEAAKELYDFSKAKFE